MADYRIHLLRDDFTKLAAFTEFVSIHTVQTVNAVGAFEIVFPESFDSKWLKVDRIIEIYRSTPDVPEYRHFSGLLRKWYWEKGETVTLVGSDWMELLKRRVVAYPRDSGQADKTGLADDVVKAYVRENLSAEAGQDRSLDAYGFSVQADTGMGSSVTTSHAWANLLQAIQDICDDATDLSEQTFFWIEHTGKNGLQFRTNVGYQRKDHTSLGAALFTSADLGNLSDPKVTYDYSDEINYVYATGREKGTLVAAMHKAQRNCKVRPRRCLLNIPQPGELQES
jgi:hypothetical protein